MPISEYQFPDDIENPFSPNNDLRRTMKASKYNQNRRMTVEPSVQHDWLDAKILSSEKVKEASQFESVTDLPFVQDNQPKNDVYEVQETAKPDLLRKSITQNVLDIAGSRLGGTMLVGNAGSGLMRPSETASKMSEMRARELHRQHSDSNQSLDSYADKIIVN